MPARKSPLLDLFPEITPYSRGFLQVDEIHNLYWEQCGNPDGVPIVLLHGGPGAGATVTHRRFFDPDHYRIVIFDQRGAGRSTPLGCIENNTTDLLVEDLETLRRHLRIERWHVFGGSWGSTLAMAYAARHAERCRSLILRGIFLCEQEEIDWFLYGMRRIFPEAWEQFAGFLPEAERGDLLVNYHKYLTHENIKIQTDAAITWTLYESACSCLLPNYETISTAEQKQHALAMARIECHYFLNEVRTAGNSLLNSLETFRNIPAFIVQGRYDVICPIEAAYRLHQLWPEAEYICVPDAGHSALDPALRSHLIAVTERVKKFAE